MIERSRRKGLDEHVSVCDQPADSRKAARTREIESGSVLSGVEILEQPEQSGSGTPPGNGPQPRMESPAGDSILVTSAPKSTSSLVQYGPAISLPISTMRNPDSAAVTPGFRLLSAPCTGAGREVRRPRGPTHSA